MVMLHIKSNDEEKDTIIHKTLCSVMPWLSQWVVERVSKYKFPELGYVAQ